MEKCQTRKFISFVSCVIFCLPLVLHADFFLDGDYFSIFYRSVYCYQKRLTWDACYFHSRWIKRRDMSSYQMIFAAMFCPFHIGHRMVFTYQHSFKLAKYILVALGVNKLFRKLRQSSHSIRSRKIFWRHYVVRFNRKLYLFDLFM